MQLRAPIERDAPTDSLHHRRRAAHVHRRPLVHPVQELGGGRQAMFVVGAHLHLVAEREQLVQERQAVPVTAGVAQRPRHTEPLGEPGHRQDRGDADAARDETELLRPRSGTGQRHHEGVARLADLDDLTHDQAMHLDGPAAAPGDPPHRDPILPLLARIPAQRVLPRAPGREVEVDVGARVPLAAASCRRGPRG